MLCLEASEGDKVTTYEEEEVTVQAQNLLMTRVQFPNWEPAPLTPRPHVPNADINAFFKQQLMPGWAQYLLTRARRYC